MSERTVITIPSSARVPSLKRQRRQSAISMARAIADHRIETLVTSLPDYLGEMADEAPFTLADVAKAISVERTDGKEPAEVFHGEAGFLIGVEFGRRIAPRQ